MGWVKKCEKPGWFQRFLDPPKKKDQLTPREINMEPENAPPGKGKSSSKPSFSSMEKSSAVSHIFSFFGIMSTWERGEFSVKGKRCTYIDIDNL